jgi:WbqC-like protein family
LKKVAILQSNYIPWKGYFDIIGLVDEFILYDEVQYTKNDWRNRNKIKTPVGIQWITVPVFQKNLHQKVSETEVTTGTWGIKQWNSIKSNYGKAPFFKSQAPIFEEFYTTFQSLLLSEINAALIKLICKQLGIATLITNSADYRFTGDPTEKLVSLCKQTGSSCYLSGPAAKNYLREDLFTREGIAVEWMAYDGYSEYPQLYPPFNHGVSIIDLLFNTGPAARQYMKFGENEN